MSEPDHSGDDANTRHRPDRPRADDGPAGSDPTAGDASPRDRATDPTRRRLLRGAGLGAAAMLGGGVAGAVTGRGTARAGESADASTADHHTAGVYDAAAPGGTAPGVVGGAPTTASAAVYGHGFQPPMGIPDDALDAVTIPPPNAEAPRAHTIDVVEATTEIADGVTVDQWTYDGTAPGPVLRATAGDRLTITVRNRTGHDHNLHLHGRHSPQMDGWEPIPPGASFTYDIEAGPAGLHPYHCHTMPLAKHVSRGLYGALIVDPETPREPAHEVVLLLSGWDLDGDGRNEIYTYNGVAGFFTRHPITVPVGELVRAYVLNMVEYEPLASFHLHAQTFDVHRSGTSATPDEHTDTVTLSQGERAIVEFRLPERGRYMFHPHQHHMAEAGAMGWFAAV